MLLVLTPESMLNAGNGEPTETFYPSNLFSGTAQPYMTATMTDDGTQKVVTLQGKIAVSFDNLTGTAAWFVSLPEEIRADGQQNLSGTLVDISGSPSGKVTLTVFFVNDTSITIVATRNGWDNVTGTAYINVDGLKYLAA